MTPQTAVPLAPHVQRFAYLHGAMRRDADRLVAALARPLTDDAAAGLAAWFARFRATIEHHHGVEDELFWPAVAARTPAMAEVEPLLVEQHHVLDECLHDVGRSLAGAAGAPDAARAATRLRAVLAEHLAQEEAGALTLVGQHLSPADFAAIEAVVAKQANLRYIRFALPWILDDLAPADRETILTDLPRPMRWLLRARWQPAYARLTAPLRSAEGAAAAA